MSMNIRFGTDTCHCSVVRQTITEDTKKILNAPDPMQAYFEWLRARFDVWVQHDVEYGDGPVDYTALYEYETKAIVAYADSHPTAEWSMA